MSLSNEERDAIVKIRLQQAKETYAEVPILAQSENLRTIEYTVRCIILIILQLQQGREQAHKRFCQTAEYRAFAPMGGD